MGPIGPKRLLAVYHDLTRWLRRAIRSVAGAEEAQAIEDIRGQSEMEREEADAAARRVMQRLGASNEEDRRDFQRGKRLPPNR